MIPFLPLLFGLTLALSAALLFSVQPLISKALLPYLGGSPAVWNTCMLFFQAVLLAGYAYAHWVVKLPGRVLLAIHGVLVLLAGCFLPLALAPSPTGLRPWETSPVLWLLSRLTLTIGLPFFMLSATAPLLQRWFSGTRHPSANDPYFLYAASNGGSLFGLLAYPLLMESALRLKEQAWVWTSAWLLLAFLLMLCAACWVSYRRNPAEPGTAGIKPAPDASAPALRWKRRGWWMFAAFVPSSWMLGVTQYLTTDIGSIPLLWILPLALYLVSFMVVFARTRMIPLKWIERWLPIGVVALALQMCTGSTDPPGLIALMHLAVFFGAAIVCHSRLAETRPHPEHLTDFYFCVALGGVFGGILNALLAPLLFNSVAEYPVAIVLACLLRGSHVPPAEGRGGKVFGTSQPNPQAKSPWRPGLGALAVLGIGLLTFAMGRFVAAADLKSPQIQAALVFAVPMLLCCVLAGWRWMFALALGAVFLGSVSFPGPHGRTILRERNFFGVSRVTLDSEGPSHRLVHGHTLHGRQFLDPERASQPIAYYHRAGPAGDIFKVAEAQSPAARVAIAGLGVGTLMAYSRPGQHWTFYEIDPAVVRIARDPRYFSYLQRGASASLQVIPGDARLRLQAAPEAAYDLIVLDAFSSDAIPVHLLTREALQLYLSKLAPAGMLAFHISSRYYQLEPVLAALAEAEGLVAFSCRDIYITEDDRRIGRAGSHWAVLGRADSSAALLRQNPRWLPVQTRPGIQAWVDDFSSPLRALSW